MWALEAAQKPSALVLDPFCGSGLTAKAAKALEMRFAGIELDPCQAEKTAKVLRRAVVL